MTIHDLPIINAILNSASAVLLVAAYASIRSNKVRPHAYLMIAALFSSGAFLTCYLIYHFNVKAKSIGLPSGLFKTCYLAMLLTHVLLAIGMLPMIFLTVTRAYSRQWDRHKRIARPTFWIWLYVSVTGVIIYVILYDLAPRMYPVAGTVGAIAGVH